MLYCEEEAMPNCAFAVRGDWIVCLHAYLQHKSAETGRVGAEYTLKQFFSIKKIFVHFKHSR